MVVITQDRVAKQDGFYQVDPQTGKSRVLLERGQHYWDDERESYVGVSPSGRLLVFPAEDAAHSLDLWATDLGFHHLRRLTHSNPELDRYAMGRARLVHWKSSDGDDLAGALLLPSYSEK